jgi:thioesterase domain-containing protein
MSSRALRFPSDAAVLPSPHASASTEREPRTSLPSPGTAKSQNIDAPTNRQELVAFWNEIFGKAQNVIVPLSETGNGLALYFVHPLSGSVTPLRYMARLLAPQHRFYGIQAPTKKRNAEFANSVESIARYYADALTAFQPEGVFALGGWSAGAIIALEVAQQLAAQGRRVGLLVAIEGAPLNTGAGISAWNPLYYWKLACNLPGWIIHNELMKSRSLRPFVRHIWRTVIAFYKMATSAMRGESIARGHVVEGFMYKLSYSEGQMSFMKALYNSLIRYVPKRYCGQVLVYSAKTQPLYYMNQVGAAWDEIAEHAEIVCVSGTHEGIMKEPQGIPLAQHLRKRLDDLAAGDPVYGRP